MNISDYALTITLCLSSKSDVLCDVCDPIRESIMTSKIYFACNVSAMIPVARGQAADVPAKSFTHVLGGPVVLLKKYTQTVIV